jgi:hypothetical protein
MKRYASSRWYTPPTDKTLYCMYKRRFHACIFVCLCPQWALCNYITFQDNVTSWHLFGTQEAIVWFIAICGNVLSQVARWIFSFLFSCDVVYSMDKRKLYGILQRMTYRYERYKGKYGRWRCEINYSPWNYNGSLHQHISYTYISLRVRKRVTTGSEYC